MNLIRIAAACPVTKVANIKFNLKNIIYCIDKALEQNSKAVIFPELSLTSYTCADLFMQDIIKEKSTKALEEICRYSSEKDILIALGAPLYKDSCIFNCAFIIFNGKILGIVPKSYIPNYTEFYEKRWFTEGKDIKNSNVDFYFQKNIPFGTDLIFESGPFKFGFEICEDLWVPIPPSSFLCLNGANIIGNLSASNEIVSKADYRKELIKSQSGRCMCSYIYSSSGVFESSTDLVFSGHLIIGENGSILKENKRFERDSEVITYIVNIDKLNSERQRNVSFRDSILSDKNGIRKIAFNFSDSSYGTFDRYIDKHPFVPSNNEEREKRCREIFSIQTAALAKRITHTGLKKAVVGISGGLDSTLALLVCKKTFDMLNMPCSNIIAITMPGFGTTDRTYKNAVDLCKYLNTDFREINIVNACLLHFKDISHDKNIYDTTYENVQARERTQILMDIANKEGGLVVGTGDLSEMALGWSTYNGDQMSMYAVNCSIPKTLVRYLVNYVAQFEMKDNVSSILYDILNTPVSPELLPKNENGKISQKTENIIGPYELHDFFLYYFIRQGTNPKDLLFLAQEAFKEEYSKEEIKKWLKVFLRRFFTQQFKRSAIPDGPKVGTVSLSPRGDLRMPSDADFSTWMQELE